MSSTLEEEADTKTERQERAFLRMTVPYLIPGGVLVYIIPQNRLDKAIARLLASRFEHIHVLRFPDPEYGDFRQIVVFGVKKANNTLDEQEALRLQSIPKMELSPLSDKAEMRLSDPGLGSTHTISIHTYRSGRTEEAHGAICAMEAVCCLDHTIRAAYSPSAASLAFRPPGSVVGRG